MIYKNFEIHNVADIIENEDGSFSWCRYPLDVNEKLEKGKVTSKCCTGVELRFVLKGDSVKIRMCATEDRFANSFHVYRGSIQGGWDDHEVNKNVTTEVKEYEIKKSSNLFSLQKMSEFTGTQWNPEVIRVVFDLGTYKIYDIIGDIEPPKPCDKPQNTILFYGSSITHGSNSLDSSHSFASIIGYNLDMDVRNIGLAGSCRMEPEVAEYIALEGEKGNWDTCVMELGINVLDWPDEHIRERVSNIVFQVASRNKDKKIFVISPFFYCGEAIYDNTNGNRWRRIIKEICDEFNFSNVTYINGLDVIDNLSYISADEVHPNIYGVNKIAETLTKIIKENI